MFKNIFNVAAKYLSENYDIFFSVNRKLKRITFIWKGHLFLA